MKIKMKETLINIRKANSKKNQIQVIMETTQAMPTTLLRKMEITNNLPSYKLTILRTIKNLFTISKTTFKTLYTIFSQYIFLNHYSKISHQ